MPRRKLTPQAVYEIRQRRAAGERVKDLAAAFNVTPGCITLTCSGKNHREVSGPRTRRDRRVQRTGAEGGDVGKIELVPEPTG